MADHTISQSNSSLTLVGILLHGTSPLVLSLVIPIATVFVWTLANYFSSPLRKYPGPFLARFTRLWYLYVVSTGNCHLVLDKLHRKHGPIVRITPNIIDIDYPEMIKSIFNTKGNWLKTPFYHASSALVDGQIIYNIFSHSDPSRHARERKPIAKYYSTSAMTAMEPHIDKVANQLFYELERRFIDGPKAGQAFDLGRWILYYTWDVVGALTFSKPIGYVEKGYDFDGTLSIADRAMDYFAMVGTMPFLDHVLNKNPYYRMGPPGFNTITDISVRHLNARYQGNDQDYHDLGIPDFLDRFIEAKTADPENIEDGQIISWLMVNLIAGADTTAITIRSALYFSLKNPQIWALLTKEVLAADFHDTIPPAYKQAKAIPYVDAVIREALRILPGVSMTMERFVPEGGYPLPNGDFLPQGTIVGMNPYVLGRNKSVYGEDVDEFRPERWLRDVAGGESAEDFQKRLLLMNQADLSFGAGSRLCIGKNLGLFQTYKVLTSLITLYEIELANPKQEWKVWNSFFPRQQGLEVKMKRRIRSFKI